MPVSQRNTDFTKLDSSESHFSINTNSTKSLRLNVNTLGTTSSGDWVAVQIKPGYSAASSGNLRGLEISPRINSTIANTNSEGVQAMKADIYLKGTTGAITGDIRVLQLELVDDFNSGTASQRTISGDTTYIWIRPAVSWTTSGIFSIIHVQAPDSGTKNPDCFIDFNAAITNVVNVTGASASIPSNTGYVLINVASTLYRLAVYANS